MLVQCKWDSSHWFDPSEKHYCNFLCEKCYFEIYLNYALLYTLNEFEKNIDFIKQQREIYLNKNLSEAEQSICKMLGVDILVKMDLFEKMYG